MDLFFFIRDPLSIVLQIYICSLVAYYKWYYPHIELTQHETNPIRLISFKFKHS